MTVRSGQSITTEFSTRRFDTGAAANADSLPAGTLYVNGTANAATVTVTNVSTGLYKAQVTLPTLALGDVVGIVIAATVNSISDSLKVWEDSKDLIVDAAGLVDATTVKLGPSGSATAQAARDIATSVLLSPGTGTGQIVLTSGAVTVATNNDKAGYALSAPGIQAIWDAATSALTTVGSIGKWILDKLNATIGSRAAPGDQMDLVNAPNATALTAIANKVESEIIDETDSEKVLTAITDKIAAVNPSLAGLTLSAIAASVRDVSNASPAPGSFGATLNTAAASAAAAATDASTAATEATAAAAALTDGTSGNAALRTAIDAGPDATAAAVLVTPAQKLVTNLDGSVNATIDTAAIAAAVVEALTASGVTVDSDSIAAIVTSLAAALATSKTIFLRSPAATTSQINLTVGDSYLAADGRALEWTIADGTLPDLTTATVGLYVDNAGTMELLKAGSVVTPTGASRVLRVELDKTDFESLTVGSRMIAAVKVTLSDRVMTLVNAVLLVSE